MEAEIHVQVKNNSPSIEVKMEEEIHAEVKDSPSIERILRPISYTSWLLGIGVAHPRKCPKAITIIIRIIYMTVCSIGMIYEAKSLLSSTYEFDINDYLVNLREVMDYVLAYYYICYGIRQYNKWPELMDRLKELDQKIKKEISMNDKSIKIVAALAVFATIFCLIIPVVFYYIYYIIYYNSFAPADFMVFVVLPNVIVAQSLINSFVFDVVVYVLYCRFQTINKLIGQLDKLSDVLAFKIRHIRELHADICEMVSIINNIYSLPLLFCSMYCFITSVTVLFELYYAFNKKETDYMIYNAKKFYSYIDSLDMADCMQCLKRAMAYVSAYYYIYHGIRQDNEWPKLMDELKEFDQKIKKEMSMNDQPIKIVEALAIFATIFYMIIPLLDKSSDALAFKIRRIRELHSDICDLARKVNDIYSLHLLFCSANSFTMAVASLFQFYSLLEFRSLYLLSSLKSFLCIVFITKFYLTCWICTLTREESDRTGRIIYEIILKYQPVNIDKHEASNISRLEVRPPMENLDGEQCSNWGNSDNLSYVDMDNLLRRNLDRDNIE
ncbi:uncharacterized protein LOC120357771 [Solenopsis invicta]|uniref:uncharacterized protein LOC120357771 n=1 Tax=Solenopsis invicta TaxID=13686 RepID=UPI00193E32E2|nr:uncharacterized protein LOC120357771 [Solenopsis invicta]